MATFTSTSGSYTTTLTVTQTSQSTQNNQSTLTYSLTLTKNSGTGLWNNNSCPWSITIDGSTVASGSFTYDFRSYSSLTLKGSTTTTVTHNSDGTKTVACSASVNMDNEPYVYVMKPSGDLTLTTIPRASDVSVSNYSIANTSGSISATITSKASFYHRWRWRMNSGSWSSWVNKGLIASTSSTVTVANTTLLAQLPSATSGSFNIEVATYSDSGYATLVGTKSASATVSVNTANIKPSVSLGNIGLNSTPIASYAVAGYSKVQSAWTTTNSSGASSVTTYFATSHGSLATTSSTSTSGTTVSGVIPSSSANYTLTISAYAKDSRGATSSTVSKSITVYGYTPPTATLNAYRVASSSSTTEDGAGTYAYVTFSGAVSSSVNSQNTIQSTTCTYSGSISGTATSGGHYALADTQTVTFTLTVTDKVTSSTAQKTISTASYPFDLYDDGNGTVGVGLGTVAVAGEVRSPLTTRVATNDGNTQLVVGSPDKSTGRTYSYVRSGGGSLYFGAGEKDGTWVAWCDVLNQAGSGKEILTVNQNLDVNWKGNIDGTATYSTNTEYARLTTTNPSTATVYYPTWMEGITSGSTYSLRANNDIRLEIRAGTTSTEGYAIFRVGNGTDKGVDGNKWGAIDIYPQYGANVCRLYANRTTATRYVSLPDGSGTLAVESTLWTGTLQGGAEQSINMSAYSRIRVYALTWGVQHVFEVDLGDAGKAQSGHGLTNTSYPFQGGSVVGHYDGANQSGTFQHYSVSVKVLDTKTKLWVSAIGYANTNGAYVNRNGNSEYYVYRVDGII